MDDILVPGTAPVTPSFNHFLAHARQRGFRVQDLRPARALPSRAPSVPHAPRKRQVGKIVVARPAPRYAWSKLPSGLLHVRDTVTGAWGLYDVRHGECVYNVGTDVLPNAEYRLFLAALAGDRLQAVR